MTTYLSAIWNGIRNPFSAAQNPVAPAPTQAAIYLPPTDQKLREAVASGNIAFVQAHITPANVNITNQSRQTLLHIAASKGRIEVVRHLLQQRPNLEARDDQGQTPFLTALSSDNYAIADDLSKAGSKIDVRDAKGNTPFHYSARIGGCSWNERLIKQRPLAAIERNNEGKTPLHLMDWTSLFNFASKQSFMLSIFTLLTDIQIKRKLSHNEFVDIFSTFMDEKTSIQGVKSILSILQYHDDETFTQDCHKVLLFFCIDKLYLETIRYLFKRNVNPNVIGEGGLTPLHNVVYKDLSSAQLDIARELIRHGADINAARGGYRYSVDSTGDRPLHCAARENNGSMVALLLQHGADSSRANSQGQRPFEIAQGDVRNALQEAYQSEISKMTWRDILASILACFCCPCALEYLHRRRVATEHFHQREITDQQLAQYDREQARVQKEADERSRLLPTYTLTDSSIANNNHYYYTMQRSIAYDREWDARRARQVASMWSRK